MTRDELIEKVANAIWHDRARHIPKSMNDLAEEIINTIFEELKEPNEEMAFAARNLMLLLGNNRPTEQSLMLWCERRGLPVPDGCENIDHVPPKAIQSAWIFKAMLNASPLAPEGNINNDND